MRRDSSECASRALTHISRRQSVFKPPSRADGASGGGDERLRFRLRGSLSDSDSAAPPVKVGLVTCRGVFSSSTFTINELINLL